MSSAHDRYRSLFEHAPMAYLTLDWSGRITDANVTAAALFGRSKAQLTGTQLASHVSPDEALRFEQHRREVAAGDGPRSCELTIQSSDRQFREVRLESVRTYPGILAWRTAIVDLTESRRLARELDHAQRLEAVGRLAGGVAHDFNNLLMAILGCAELALRTLPGGVEARDTLEQMQRLVLRGRSTVADLLAFATPDAEQAPLVEVDRAIEGSRIALRQLLGDAVALEIELQATGVNVRLDAGRFERVLLNLVRNARHAISGVGRVRIETKLAERHQLDGAGFEASDEGSYVRIAVSDTGSGMDTATRLRAFEPFFTTKTADEGTGLGLSMVYGTIEQAGGRIELNSQPGMGTEVVMYLPEVREQPRTGVKPVAPIQGDGMNVLVVEDDRLVRMTVCHYLERLGYHVFDAAHAEEALDVLRKESVQLMIIDVVLPGVKGPDLAMTARELHPDLAMVFISAHSLELLVERGWIKAGAVLLRKPFSAEELHNAVLSLSGAKASRGAG